MWPTYKDEPSSYDNTPYPGYPYPATHPDLLAAVATLSGMKPPPVRSCRVLEVGCGDGSNIIPMATSLPYAEFIGIDLAEKPIRRAQAVIDRTSIKNISLRAMDLLDVTSEFGQFDYIIAHGFYSWVPAPLQDKLLTVCDELLAPNGIAFISYNTYPAAHFRRAFRDIMLFHLKNVSGNDRVKQGKAIVEFIIDCIEDKDRAAWKTALQEELTRVNRREDNVVYHDELNAIYSPVYFEEFVMSAAAHGLQFLGEASLHEVISCQLKPELEHKLKEFSQGNLVEYHQYLDFIQFRGFRRTLLCRSAISLERDMPQDILPTLLMSSPLREVSRKPDGKITFKKQQGHGFVETDHAVMVAAIKRLEEVWPRAESFDDLLKHVGARVPVDGISDVRSTLSEALSLLIANTLVQCRTYDLPVPISVPARPVASPLARVQAEEGTTVTTLMQTQVEIEDSKARHFLRLLDGSRDCRALAGWLSAGTRNTSLGELLKEVNNHLEEFRRLGLLIATAT